MALKVTITVITTVALRFLVYLSRCVRLAVLFWLVEKLFVDFIVLVENAG